MRGEHHPTIIAALVKLKGRVVDVRSLDAPPYGPPSRPFRSVTSVSSLAREREWGARKA